MKILLSIITLPWLILYISICILGIIPYIPQIIKHMNEGGSLDMASLEIFIQEKTPWAFELGDIPDAIKIIISILIWFWLFY